MSTHKFNSIQFIQQAISNHRYTVILSFCTGLALVLFILTLPDYGISYDELNLYEYADRMIDAYSKTIQGDSIDHLLDFYDLKFYGPSYLVFGRILIYGLRWLIPGLAIYHAWHMVNFATFLVAVWLIYALTARFTSRKAAMFSAILFLTQPLLWGHGVMNLKDIPFLTVFLGAVTVGFTFIDLIEKTNEGFFRSLTSRIGDKQFKVGWWKGILLLLWLVILVDRVFGNFLTHPLIQRILTISFDPSAETLLSRFVMSLVEPGQSIPITDYISKAMRLVNLTEFLFLLVVAIGFGWKWYRGSSKGVKWLVFAGVISGLAFSVRILGFAAGGMVVLYILMNQGKKGLPWVIGYVMVMMTTAYLTWPYLWGDPIGRVFESFKVMSEFPWVGTVRFEGRNIVATNLPWYYLPKLISIQFTLPVILLSLIGSLTVVWKSIKEGKGWHHLALLLAWFWLPLLAFIIANPPIYDNFRQMLFITPPLFIISGILIGKIMDRVGHRWVNNMLIIALILPGIIAGIWLHPYQYIYYNGLVGWTGNIQRHYESDYWGTSMCEAAETISSQTMIAAVVIFSDQVLSQLFTPCMSHPLDIRIIRDGNTQLQTDFAVLNSRFDSDLHNFVHLQVDHTIHRGKTIFSVIKIP